MCGGIMSDLNSLLTVFKAAADPTRLRILKMLLIKPLCVCEVMHVLNMAQSTASQHLKILLAVGFVEASSGGTWTVYQIAKKPAPLIASLLNAIRDVPETDMLKKDAALARKVDRNRICLQKMKRRHLKRGVA